MNIDGITNGIVLDHITAGTAMKIYKYLNLEELDCSVAVLKNVPSSKMGKKDIIKIDTQLDINMDALGYLDEAITVNIVKEAKLVGKKRTELPEKLVNVMACKNPRCITSIEQEIPQSFRLADKERKLYRCEYCDGEN
ncbi:MAG: aspartate carbamoyltransferase regulatory subunit [Anaerovoracaceae bacterium]